MDVNLTRTLNLYFCKMDGDTKAFLDNLASENDNKVVAIYCVPASDSFRVTTSLSVKVSRDLSQVTKYHLRAPRANATSTRNILVHVQPLKTC